METEILVGSLISYPVSEVTPILFPLEGEGTYSIPKVFGHVTEYVVQGANPQRVMVWNGDITRIARMGAGKSHVAAPLASEVVTVSPPQQDSKLHAR